MTQTIRSLVMRITADASQAEAEVDALNKKLSGPESFGFGRGGGGIGGIDRSAAAQRESAIRGSVGVLGDIDTALQTFGSTTGTVGLQIAGDLFAMGEAAGQLRAALPGLVANFGGLGLAMGAVGIAVGALVAAMVLANQETTAVVQGIQQSFVARLDAERQYANLSAQEAANMLAEKQKQLETEVAINEKAQEFRTKTWEQIVADQSATFGIFGDLAARIKILFAGGTGQLDEAVNQSNQNLADLKAEIAVLGETAGDTKPEVKSAAESFDFSMAKLSAGMDTTATAADAFSSALKVTEQAFEGVKRGMALTSKTIKDGRVVAQSAEETAQFATNSQKSMIDDNARMYEERLRQIQDYERRKFEIEQNYQQAAWQAERSNDVIGFRNAGETRQRDLARAGTTIVINNAAFGSVLTPADGEQMKQDVTNLLIEVAGARKGMY